MSRFKGKYRNTENRRRKQNKRVKNTRTANLSQKYSLLSTRCPNLRAYRVSSPIRAFIWRWKYIAFIIVALTFTHTVISVISTEGIGNVQVLVAKDEIAVGEVFDTNNTVTRLYPENAVPQNSFTSIQQINGKTASATISRGLPITASLVLDDQYLSNAPEGMVLASIILRDDISAKLLRPGNHIELYAPATIEGEAAKLLTSGAVVMGKPENDTSSSIFSKVEKTTVLYAAIKKEDAGIILGLQTNTPLQAVILNT